MAYPDWVLKFKSKGTYVQIRKGKYFLYRGHSERVSGISYPVLKFDEYLGQVTEDDGLIPPKPTVRSGLQVFTFGPFLLIHQITGKIVSNLSAVSPLSAKQLAVLAQLKLVYDRWGVSLYAGSWLSLQFPGLFIPKEVAHEAQFVIDRVVRMLRDKLSAVFDGSFEQLMDLAGRVYLVSVNNQWVVSAIPEELKAISQAQKIHWEVNERGQKA
jgi:hypothetical protein